MLERCNESQLSVLALLCSCVRWSDLANWRRLGDFSTYILRIVCIRESVFWFFHSTVLVVQALLPAESYPERYRVNNRSVGIKSFTRIGRMACLTTRNEHRVVEVYLTSFGICVLPPSVIKARMGSKPIVPSASEKSPNPASWTPREPKCECKNCSDQTPPDTTLNLEQTTALSKRSYGLSLVMERSKRNVRKKISPESLVVDEYHSLETPSCQLVVQVAKDVVPDLTTIATAAADQEGSNTTTTTSTTTTTPESSFLGTLVLQHLLEERRNQSSAKRKPKKKRKKKNRTAKAADEDGDAISTNATLTQQQRPQQLSHTTTTLEPHETTIPNSSQIVGDQTSPIVLHWLDRLVVRAAESKPVAAAITTTTSATPSTPSTTTATTSRTLTAFCESLTMKPPPKLLTSDISKALARPTCVPCRAAAESYWQSTGIPMQDLGLVPGDDHTEKIVLESSMIEPWTSSKRSIPITGMEEEHDIDRAFDYQAMEEGLPISNRKQYLSPEEQKANQIVILEPVVDKEGKIEAIQVTSELNAAAVERLIRLIVLPCALSELEHPNAVPITDEQFTSLEGHVTSHQQRMHHQLTQLREKRSKAHELLQAAAMKNAPTTGYDVKTASALTDCNKECDQLLTVFVAILLQITTLTDGLPDAEWAHLRTKRLWDSYENGLQKILMKSLQHEGTLLQLASRPGVVPNLFMNAAHRFSFYEVIKEKYHVLDAFYIAFFSTLQDEIGNPGGPTFLRKLMTYQPFTDGTVLESKTWLDRTNVDSTVASLVGDYAELVQNVRIIHLAEVQKANEEKCAKLFNLVQRSKSMLADEYDTFDWGNVDQNVWKELRREGSLLISHYETHLPMPDPVDDKEFNGEFKTNRIIELAEMRQKLAKMVLNMTSQWRCLRWMRSQRVEAPVMPLRLLKFMNQVELDNPISSACQGGGGKRRVAGVLASLLYQHLVVLCNEWHAEITQSELLESMGQLVEPTEVKAATKKRKKKKSSPTTVVPLLAGKATEARSADSSDSDEFSETQTPAASISVINAKESVPESHEAIQALDTSHLQMPMNGFHKPHVGMDKNEVHENESEPDLVEERDVDVIVNSKKRRRNIKAEKQPDVILVKNEIQSKVHLGNEVTKTKDPRPALPTDTTNSRRLKDRQRKPSPPKDVADCEGSSPQKDDTTSSPPNAASNQKKPKDTTKQRKRSSPSESADSKTQTPTQSSKQRRPSPPMGSPATAALDSKSSATNDPKNSNSRDLTKQPSVLAEILDTTSPNSTTQNQTSTTKDVVDEKKYDGSTKQRKPSPPKTAIDTQRPADSTKQRMSSPREAIAGKVQQPRESRKQRKSSPPKVAVDPNCQELKGTGGKQRTASPAKEANSGGRHKDSGKRDSKTDPKDKGDAKQQQSKRTSGGDSLDKRSETVVSSEEPPLQRNPKKEAPRATTNGVAKEMISINDNVVDNPTKETATIQQPNAPSQLPSKEENSAATPTPRPTVSTGVEDSSGTVEPVEEFLVSRFLAILEAGSFDAKGNPIIFL